METTTTRTPPGTGDWPAAAKYCWLLLVPLGWLAGRRDGNP